MNDVKRLRKMLRFGSVISTIGKLITAAVIVFALTDAAKTIKKAV